MGSRGSVKSAASNIDAQLRVAYIRTQVVPMESVIFVRTNNGAHQLAKRARPAVVGTEQVGNRVSWGVSWVSQQFASLAESTDDVS